MKVPLFERGGICEELKSTFIPFRYSTYHSCFVHLSCPPSNLVYWSLEFCLIKLIFFHFSVFLTSWIIYIFLHFFHFFLHLIIICHRCFNNDKFIICQIDIKLITNIMGTNYHSVRQSVDTTMVAKRHDKSSIPYPSTNLGLGFVYKRTIRRSVFMFSHALYNVGFFLRSFWRFLDIVFCSCPHYLIEISINKPWTDWGRTGYH